jgi:hypothetical protein
MVEVLLLVLLVGILIGAAGFALLDGWLTPPYVDPQAQAMEAVDQLFEASEQASEQMRRIAGKHEGTAWSPFGDEAP